MARVRDYRNLTGIPTPPPQDSALKITQFYTNTSGILLAMNATGMQFTVGCQLTGTANQMTPKPTGLQTVGAMTLPNDWMPIYGPSGQFFLVPLYLSSSGVYP